MAKKGGSAAAQLEAMKRNCKSYYDLLGVPPTAHLDDIKKAFRSKVLLLHPDKNQDAPDEAAELFSLVQVAYNTLSQVELRDKYDASLRASGDERMTPLMIEGNEIWQAFEVMDKFKSEGFAVLSKVDELEQRFKIPAGQLRFREGVPCAGYDSACCHIQRLSPDDCTGLVDTTTSTAKKTSTTAAAAAAITGKRKASKAARLRTAKSVNEGRRILLCRRHAYLHMCEGDQCTAEEQVCPLYALWLVERWMDARKERWRAMFKRGGWRVEMSKEGQPYWFNLKTGRSLWVDEWEREEVLRARDERIQSRAPKEEKTGKGTASRQPGREEEERHACTFGVCGRHGFEKLDEDVWVCRVGKAPHMCTTLQCHLTRREQSGAVVCWATRKVYAAGSGEEETYAIGDYEASVLPEDKEAKALGMEIKTLTYVSETTGQVVTTEVEVPYGLNLDFSGPGLIEYGTLGRRVEDDEVKTRRRDIKRIKKLEIDLNEEKRREREEMKITEMEDVVPEATEEDDVTAAEKQIKQQQEEEDKAVTESTTMKPPPPSSHARSRLRKMMVEKEQAKTEQEREEDIYAHASDTIYSIYGGSLDLVGHRKDEEWETIQGFAGGFEGVQEEEEEERDVEQEAKEMKALRHKKLEYKAKMHVGLIEPKKERKKPDV